MASFANESTRGRQMDNAKRIIPVLCGAVGLVAGCVAAYFILSTLWTRIVVQPADVSPRDLYIVLTLSIVAGVFTGFLALRASAQRYWNSRNKTPNRHVS